MKKMALQGSKIARAISSDLRERLKSKPTSKKPPSPIVVTINHARNQEANKPKEAVIGVPK